MNTSLFRQCILAGTLTLGVIATTALAADKDIKVGDSFPDLAGFPLEGKLPKELKGRVVLVDFWASWCGPCKESFPVMEELQTRFGTKGLVVLAVNLDDESKTMNDFLKKRPVSFTIVRDASKQLVSSVNIKSVPCSFIITPDGKVASIHQGFRGQETRAQYLREIEELIAANFASQ